MCHALEQNDTKIAFFIAILLFIQPSSSTAPYATALCWEAPVQTTCPLSHLKILQHFKIISHSLPSIFTTLVFS